MGINSELYGKTDIILAGVGGQGILSIAAVIGLAAIREGMFLKQAEVHGMSQRGGAVQSHLRLSSSPVASDLIPLGRADLILSVEPMESLRYISWLRSGGWIIVNSVPFKNIDNYPDMERIYEEIRKLPNHTILDAEEIAEGSGSARSSNMVILGAASHVIPISLENFEAGIQSLFKNKGEELVQLNKTAFLAGRNSVLLNQ